MRINKIAVKGLFGVFNHEIPLNENSGITIVIGENGLGKTVILEAIGAFFGKNFGFFKDLEFSEFSFYFDNHEIWKIKKMKDTKDVNQRYLYLDRAEKDGKSKQFKIFEFESNSKNNESRGWGEVTRRRYEQEMLHNFRISRPTEEEIVEYRMLYDHHRRNEIMHAGYEGRGDSKLPKPVSDAMNEISIKIIETQRIITAKNRGSDAYINTVVKSSTELAEKISAVAKRASEVTTDLDGTYPNRLVTKLKQDRKDSFAELNAALITLDERRKLLSSLGLVENTHDSDLLQISNEQKDLLIPLKLYIDDSHQKLAPYEDVSNKIKLFTGIVNKRFKHKKLEINKDKGFVFRSTVKKNDNDVYETISPLKLSSGEQNELVMFYELIFNSKIGDMILIDEPELSLHISWQNKFINDLKEVTFMNKVSIIIATHSPDIIDENWDLKIELNGVE